jgi:hypothetical protein
VFALALAVALLVLLLSPLLTVPTASFLDPRTVGDAEEVLPEEVGAGAYLALAEVRPEEEPPPASAVVVEAFGWDVSMDGTALTWGASVRNTHGEYAARLGVQVTVDGVPLYEEEGAYSSVFGTMILPGGEFGVGRSRHLDGGLPSDPVVEFEVVHLEWFAFDGGTPPEPQAPPLTVRVDGIDEGDEPRGRMRFSVTVVNSADYAIVPWLSAVFRRADGTPVGGATLFSDLAVPPGESVRGFLIWKQDIPAGADLSLTEFVPSS